MKTLLMLLGAVIILADMTPPMSAKTRRYRVVWDEDPCTCAVIGWERHEGAGGTVRYRRLGEPNAPFESQAITRTENYHDMTHCFARLRGLSPDSHYEFFIEDSDSRSERFSFLTAPAEAKPFTFCAGGDSRNHRRPRQRANATVAKLRPLFVAFTGDMIDRDTPEEWKEWLDDWQMTFTEDRRIIPILPHRGNHEALGNETIDKLFDTTPSNFYALSLGGDLLRFYVLNSEISAGGEQRQWLEKDLKEHSSKVRHLCAGYHKPMRPVVSAKPEGNDEYLNWAALFYEHGMDLVFESDSHAIKRTLPLRPSTGKGSSEGFIAAPGDPKATIYSGEGCWGAPLRAAQDEKPWILALDSFNGIDWIHVYPERIELRTVRVDSEPKFKAVSRDNETNPPSGLELWNPPSGSVLTIPGD